MSHFLYIIQSEKDNGHYVGISKDPLERLRQHNAGKTFSTRFRKPFKLVYTEEFDSYKEARGREKFLKSYAGVKEKQEIIKNITR